MTNHFRTLTMLLGLSAAGISPAATQVAFPRLAGVGDDFTFLIHADAHANRQQPTPRNPRPHNLILREFVADANALTPPPALVIFNGDIYEREAVPESTNALLQIVKQLNALPIAVSGNHDARDFDVDHIFRPVQQAFNGTTNHTFSFNCGQWHFVVLPTKELLSTPAAEAALLDWLARDLDAHRARPTMVFTHYHILPVGTSQLEYYTQSLDFKNRLLEVLVRSGNVKYVFSGHVHAGIQNSIKTAWSYRGVHFVINPSGVRPRPFGEEYPEFDQDGGWYTRVVIRGATARLFGRQNGKTAEREYPATFRVFDPAIDPRALTPIWHLPAGAALRNGGFEDGLNGWLAPYRYRADHQPGYDAAALPDRRATGQSAARLWVREKGPHWALGEFTEIYQVIQAPRGRQPVLRFKYSSEAATHGGGYAWLAGFKGKEVQNVMLFHWGPKLQQRHTLTRVMSFVISGGDYEGARLAELTRQRRTAFWKLPDTTGPWHEVHIALGESFRAATGQKQALDADRFLLGLGAWCSAESGAHSTVWFEDVSLTAGEAAHTSRVNRQPFDATHQGLNLLVESDRSR